MEKLTAENLLQLMRKNEEKMQNEFIDKIYDAVDLFANKVSSSTYQITQHERDTFKKIETLINEAKKKIN